MLGVVTQPGLLPFRKLSGSWQLLHQVEDSRPVRTKSELSNSGSSASLQQVLECLLGERVTNAFGDFIDAFENVWEFVHMSLLKVVATFWMHASVHVSSRRLALKNTHCRRGKCQNIKVLKTLERVYTSILPALHFSLQRLITISW